jgi:hypothetical protein
MLNTPFLVGCFTLTRKKNLWESHDSINKNATSVNQQYPGNRRNQAGPYDVPRVQLC